MRSSRATRFLSALCLLAAPWEFVLHDSHIWAARESHSFEEMEMMAGTHTPSVQASAAHLSHGLAAGDALELLRSLELAEQAVEKAPSPDARFNLARAEEALWLTRDAEAAWNELRSAPSGRIRRAAEERWSVTGKRLGWEAATQWPLNRGRLSDAVRNGDRAALTQLIAPYPGAAERYVENEILLAWARARNSAEESEQLRLAIAISDEVAKITGDRYLLDDLNLIEGAASNSAALEKIRNAHVLLGVARSSPRPDAAAYRPAVAALEEVGSPLGAGARVDLAIALTLSRQSLAEIRAALDPAETFAQQHGYWNVWARVQAHRGYLLVYRESRYVDALAAYDAALRTFERLHDGEAAANVHTRKNGILQILGRCDLAWQEAFLALRDAGRLIDFGGRHITLGEAATAALCLDAPHAALRYQEAAVRLVQDLLSSSAKSDHRTIDLLRDNLSIALRARAAIEIRLDRREAARRDTSEAVRLANETHREENRSIHDALMARVDEIEGQLSLRDGKPDRAAAAFSRALRIPNVYHTFHAALLAERAEAYRKAGETKRAENDLIATLAELRSEESNILLTRRRGSGEKLWSSYFERPQDAYDTLIRMLADQHRNIEAFDTAERARGFEPLNLVLDSGQAPEEFRRLVIDRQPLSLKTIQSELPRGTFILEFAAGADRTLSWIVSHDDFAVTSASVGNADIRALSAAIEQGARTATGSRKDLARAYDALFAKPLAKIAAMRGGNLPSRRLVVVPHGFIHALPIAALWNSRAHHYLVQDWTVAIAPSATLYVFSLIRDALLPSAPEQQHELLIGDPAFDTQLDIAKGLNRLPLAREEVRQIQQVYGDTSEVVPPINATVPHFLDAAHGSTVVHLAGHAIVNPNEPYHSALLLAPSPHQTGVIEAEELLASLRPERARVFVLSACSSAGGVPIGAEGLGPLVRPLAGAGLPAVVGSIWSIHDLPSKQVMVAFHRHYHSGNDVASALRMAQLDAILADERVLTWAPFEVIGFASSPYALISRE